VASSAATTACARASSGSWRAPTLSAVAIVQPGSSGR
jgi:hypothetical protein